MLWTRKQLAPLALLAAGLFIALLIRFSLNRSYISDPQDQDGAKAGHLAEGIDPNTATAADLAALPIIGTAMARRIIDERNASQKSDPGRPAFSSPEDLLRVKGIGQARLREITPYLRFPTTTKSTTDGHR